MFKNIISFLDFKTKRKVAQLKKIHEELAYETFIDMCRQFSDPLIQRFLKNHQNYIKNFTLVSLPEGGNKKTSMYMLKENNLYVGYMQTTHFFGRSELKSIEYLYIRPKYRGNNIASQWVSTTIKNKNFCSNHEGESDAMRKIWTRLGFSKSDTLNVFGEAILFNLLNFNLKTDQTIDYYIAQESEILENMKKRNTDLNSYKLVSG